MIKEGPHKIQKQKQVFFALSILLVSLILISGISASTSTKNKVMKITECKYSLNDPTFNEGIVYAPGLIGSTPTKSGSKGMIFKETNLNTNYGEYDKWKITWYQNNDLINDGYVYPTKIPLIDLTTLPTGDNYLYVQCNYTVGSWIPVTRDYLNFRMYSTDQFNSGVEIVDAYKKIGTWPEDPDQGQYYIRGPGIEDTYSNNYWNFVVPLEWTGGVKDSIASYWSYSNNGYNKHFKEGLFPNTLPYERWKLKLDGLPTSLVLLEHVITTEGLESIANVNLMFYIKGKEPLQNYLIPASSEPLWVLGNLAYPKWKVYKDDIEDTGGHMLIETGHKFKFEPYLYNPYSVDITATINSGIATSCWEIVQACSADLNYLWYSQNHGTVVFPGNKDTDPNYPLQNPPKPYPAEINLVSPYNENTYTFGRVHGFVSVAGTKPLPSNPTGNSELSIQGNIGSDNGAYLTFWDLDPVLTLHDFDGAGPEPSKPALKMNLMLSAGFPYSPLNSRNNKEIDLNPGSLTYTPYNVTYEIYNGNPAQGGILLASDNVSLPDAFGFRGIIKKDFSLKTPFSHYIELPPDALKEGDQYFAVIYGQQTKQTPIGKFAPNRVTKTISNIAFRWEDIVASSDKEFDFYVDNKVDQTEIVFYNPSWPSLTPIHFDVEISNFVPYPENPKTLIRDNYEFWLVDADPSDPSDPLYNKIKFVPTPDGKNMILPAEIIVNPFETKTYILEAKSIHNPWVTEDKIESFNFKAYYIIGGKDEQALIPLTSNLHAKQADFINLKATSLTPKINSDGSVTIEAHWSVEGWGATYDGYVRDGTTYTSKMTLSDEDGVMESRTTDRTIPSGPASGIWLESFENLEEGKIYIIILEVDIPIDSGGVITETYSNGEPAESDNTASIILTLPGLLTEVPFFTFTNALAVIAILAVIYIAFYYKSKNQRKKTK